MQHTPGPWRYVPIYGGMIYGTEQPEPVYSTQVASVCTGDRDPLKETPLGIANGRLLAAAPELLAACEALLAPSLDIDNEAACDAVEEQARAAIAKARGDE